MSRDPEELLDINKIFSIFSFNHPLLVSRSVFFKSFSKLYYENIFLNLLRLFCFCWLAVKRIVKFCIVLHPIRMLQTFEEPLIWLIRFAGLTFQHISGLWLHEDLSSTALITNQNILNFYYLISNKF